MAGPGAGQGPVGSGGPFEGAVTDVIALPDVPFGQDRRRDETPAGEVEAALTESAARGAPSELPEGLPVRDVTCVSEDVEGVRWYGTSAGAIRQWVAAGTFDFFQGRRWLPDDRVEAVVATPDGGAWVQTASGITRIARERMTLAGKAALFERHVRERHCRRGFVAGCRLVRPGDTGAWQHVAEDNDGLWTALYVAAECFRYAATGDEEARRFATQSVNALMDLERLTPIAGYPARAIALRDEDVVRSDYEKGRWREEADGLQWKGDTSADELDGHFFAYATYFDLVAEGSEREEVRRVATRIMDHVLEHDLLLVEKGTHTTWGVYGPRLLNDPTSRYYGDQGLFSLCILSHLRVVEHMWREVDRARADRFAGEYRRLVDEHGYAENVLKQNFPPPFPQNHSDDEMAFIAYEPLLRLETDETLRAVYVRALRKDWEIERPERSPFTNFLYASAVGTRECDAVAAVETLREIPLDQVRWGMRNSHRADLPRADGADRFRAAQAAVALRASERDMQRWNANPYRLDSEGDGLSEGDGVYFLLPYWLGRYLGVIGG